MNGHFTQGNDREIIVSNSIGAAARFFLRKLLMYHVSLTYEICNFLPDVEYKKSLLNEVLKTLLTNVSSGTKYPHDFCSNRQFSVVTLGFKLLRSPLESS